MCSLQPRIQKHPFNWESPNTGLSWSAAAAKAGAIGGRLPYSKEMMDARISDGSFDQWQPVADSPGLWVQTGDAGRIYMTEGGMNGNWYNSVDVHPWRPTSTGSTMGSPVHHFWVMTGT